VVEKRDIVEVIVTTPNALLVDGVPDVLIFAAASHACFLSWSAQCPLACSTKPLPIDQIGALGNSLCGRPKIGARSCRGPICVDAQRFLKHCEQRERLCLADVKMRGRAPPGVAGPIDPYVGADAVNAGDFAQLDVEMNGAHCVKGSTHLAPALI
jgi:hypothetical protein